VTTSLLAMATVLAANAAGRRERASGTGELFDATATSRSRRTTAQLLSSAWPSSMTIVVVAAAVVLLAVRGGQHLEVADALRLAQVPLVVAGFSALGTALGRLSPMPAPAIFAATLAFFLPFPADGERPLDWLAPFASWGWSSLPSLGWHAVYLLGGVVAISSLALIVTGARRRAALVLALAIAAGAGAATFQLPVECHDVDLVGKVCTF
jgi:hypothetical protein